MRISSAHLLRFALSVSVKLAAQLSKQPHNRELFIHPFFSHLSSTGSLVSREHPVLVVSQSQGTQRQTKLAIAPFEFSKKLKWMLWRKLEKTRPQKNNNNLWKNHFFSYFSSAPLPTICLACEMFLPFLFFSHSSILHHAGVDMMPFISFFSFSFKPKKKTQQKLALQQLWK